MKQKSDAPFSPRTPRSSSAPGSRWRPRHFQTPITRRRSAVAARGLHVRMHRREAQLFPVRCPIPIAYGSAAILKKRFSAKKIPPEKCSAPICSKTAGVDFFVLRYVLEDPWTFRTRPNNRRVYVRFRRYPPRKSG
jgi:hypothetical protein